MTPWRTDNSILFTEVINIFYKTSVIPKILGKFSGNNNHTVTDKISKTTKSLGK